MDLSAFEEHLDRHGGDLDAWPEAIRAEAAALFETSAPARAALRGMAEAEAWLRVRPAPSTATLDATAFRAMAHRQERPSRRLAVRAGWAAAAALVLSLGVSLGGMTPPEHDDSPDHAIAVAFDTTGSLDVD